MRIALLGHMGRDEALAGRLQEHELHVLGEWRNPGLVEKAEASGGQFRIIDSVVNTEQVADFVEAVQPDMFLTNFDAALAAGVVDVIGARVKERKINELLMPCPDRETARVEWDKFYLRDIIEEIGSNYNPVNFMAETIADAMDAVTFFEENNTEMALKPRNLTGGKGVKVQGKHFNTHQEGREYAARVLADENQTGIEIQEKLVGHEFTLQLFTDGKTSIKPPATYDYPYREDGDSGPGTGGMGAFSMQEGELLPFVTQDDYDEALGLMDKLLGALRDRGHDYKGVLYPTFFKTPNGLKIVEVNARGGDPELINIISLIEDDVDVGEVLKCIATGDLAPNSVRYKKLASAMVYLVSPEYGYKSGSSYEFNMDSKAIEHLGCSVLFAAAERFGANQYRTVGSSRTVGVSSLGKTPWEARNNIHEAIREGFWDTNPLHYRREVAERAYIKSLGM